MGKIIVFYLLALLLNSCTTFPTGRVVDVSTYKAVFTEPPKNVPTVKTPDGPLAGNGDIGITMGGTPDSLCFYLGKNDFWWPYEEYPNGISLPGGLNITIPALEGASYYVEQRPGEADIIGRFANENIKVDVKVVVPRTRNMVVFEITADRACNVQLGLWATTGHASVTQSGRDGNVSWATRSFDEPDDTWPCHIALAMKAPESSVLELKPGKSQAVALFAYTNFDRSDWKETAIAEAGRFTEAGMDAIMKEHRSWWNDFWKESYVAIGDTMLEKFYYMSTYIFAMSSQKGKVAPGIWGSFITSDSSLWGGDYHLNYNYQSPFWAFYSSNHLSLVDNYDQPLLDFMERGRELSRTLLGCRGIYYPVGLGPKGYCASRWPRTPGKMMEIFHSEDCLFEGGYQFHGQKINAVFGVGNMLMRFYSTYDEAYANRVYPYMLACADFWEDYLVFEDGRYVIYNDHFNETSPSHHNKGNYLAEWGDKNSTLSLGLVNMLFKGVLDVSAFLGVDSGRREKWEHILAHISDYPTGQHADGLVALKNMEKGALNKDVASGLNRISMHGLVLPAGVAGPLSNPELNRVLLDDVARWKKNKRRPGSWGNGGFETVFAGAVRIGYDANLILEEMKERIEVQHYPNLWIHQGGGGVETLTGVPLTINEMLMQSYEGAVRVFPNWTGKDARFHNLRAYGAFLVSSSLKDGKIPSVTVKSEKGRVLKIENPWKNSQVQVRFENGKKEVVEGEYLNIPTFVNETIVLSPMSKK